MSGYGAYISGFVTVDYHTESAGTAITENIQGQNGKRLALLSFEVVTGSTAHTLLLMYPGTSSGSRNTTSAAAASGQKDIVCTNNPTDPAGNAAAANDILAYQVTDGTWEFNTVASLSSKTITCGTNLAKAVASGAKVRIFGVAGDNYSHQITLAASTTNKNGDVPITAVNPYKGDPWYIYIANATNASKIMHMLLAYINK